MENTLANNFLIEGEMKFGPDLRSPATSQNSLSVAPIRAHLEDHQDISHVGYKPNPQIKHKGN